MISSTLNLQNELGDSFLYTIGGWNTGGYLATVHRIKVGTGGVIFDGDWEAIDSFQVSRADPACAEVQYGWTKGIMVAGGYRMDGAWLDTVEFFNYKDSM